MTNKQILAQSRFVSKIKGKWLGDNNDNMEYQEWIFSFEPKKVIKNKFDNIEYMVSGTLYKLPISHLIYIN